MAKFFGKVGYVETVETTPGNWTEQVTERNYYGDVLRSTSKRTSTTDSTNDNITIDAQISIMTDQFVYQNFQHIKYVEYLGVKWNVTSVDPQPPRLTLTLGGVYNGE